MCLKVRNVISLNILDYFFFPDLIFILWIAICFVFNHFLFVFFFLILSLNILLIKILLTFWVTSLKNLIGLA